MKKTQYLTSENREVKAQEFMAEAHPNGRSRGPDFDISQAALLVLDMQRYFLDKDSHAYIPSSDAILGPIQRLIDGFHAQNRTIIFTRHIDPESEGNPMRMWWKDALDEDDELSQLMPTMRYDSATVLVKSSYDAFHATELDLLLRDAGIKQVVICGVMTHLCVETTARSAFCHGYNVFLPVNATATTNEDHHLATIRNLSHGFARITSVDELLGTQI